MKNIHNNIIHGIISSFDRCDPTRSRELKPSDRIRDAMKFHRQMIVVYKCLATVVGVILAVIWLLM